MKMPSRAQLDLLRQRYPPGTEVELIAMPEDPYPVPPGTRGKVIMVDDAGQLVMKWSNGSSLSLIPGVDSFQKVFEQELKQKTSMTMGGM